MYCDMLTRLIVVIIHSVYKYQTMMFIAETNIIYVSHISNFLKKLMD